MGEIERGRAKESEQERERGDIEKEIERREVIKGAHNAGRASAKPALKLNAFAFFGAKYL